MKPGKPIYIIVDDLTGAADSANYFRTPLHRVRVISQKHRGTFPKA